jgi:hypothetical protein
MILQQNNIDRQILLKFLGEGICQVSFTKVKDNTNRVMLCTLKADQLPAKFEKAIEGIYRPAVDEDLLPVWDVTEGKWKSFRISKIVSFRTPDELVNNDKEGQDVESSQKEILEKRKQTAKQSFEKRVQKQKEQAQKSKENLDKARSIVNKLRGIQNEN